MYHHAPLQTTGNGLNGHIIMGGTHTASRKDIVKRVRAGYHILGNDGNVIRNYHNTTHVNTEGTELLTQVWGIGINNFPRQNLVANDNNASRFCHSTPVSEPVTRFLASAG
jgi:hypothetical protein